MEYLLGLNVFIRISILTVLVVIGFGTPIYFVILYIEGKKFEKNIL